MILKNIHIELYQDEHQPYFESLNKDWIEEYFWMESLDEKVLKFPRENILNPGGEILVATFQKKVIGVAAIKWVSEGVFEFTKMAVDKNYRGMGIGKKLTLACIQMSRQKNAHTIILYSSTKLTTAIHLYKILGFQEIPVDMVYKRSDIKMELKL